MVRGVMVLLREVWIGMMYKLLGRVYTNGCLNIVTVDVDEISSCLVDSTMLWHQWLGNIREKGIHAIYSKGTVKGFPNFSLEFNFYEHYVYGRHSHVRLPYGATRAKEIMELVSSYVFGLVPIPSLGGS